MNTRDSFPDWNGEERRAGAGPRWLRVTPYVHLGHLLAAGIPAVPLIVFGLLWLFSAQNSAKEAELGVQALTGEVAGLTTEVKIVQDQLGNLQATMGSVQVAASNVPVQQATIQDFDRRLTSVQTEVDAIRGQIEDLQSRVAVNTAQINGVVQASQQHLGRQEGLKTVP